MGPFSGVLCHKVKMKSQSISVQQTAGKGRSSCILTRRQNPPTDVRSDKGEVAPTYSEHSSLSLADDQPGPFGKRKFAERNWLWTVGYKRRRKEWCVTFVRAYWLIAVCQSDFGVTFAVFRLSLPIWSGQSFRGEKSFNCVLTYGGECSSWSDPVWLWGR